MTHGTLTTYAGTRTPPGKAPRRYPKGRPCEMNDKCARYENGQPGRLHRYAGPVHLEGADGGKRFLCSSCIGRHRDALVYVDRAPGRPVGRSIRLPHLGQTRRDAGLTRRALGERAEITGDAIYKIECGRNAASTGSAARLAAALGVSVEDLMGEDD